MGFRIAYLTAVLVCLTATGGTVSGQDAPAGLTLAEGPALSGRAYSLTLVQDVSLSDGGAHIVRDARLRYRFTDGERLADDRSRVAIVFDSARAAVSSPHGREVIDARRLVGRPLGLEYGHDGDPVEWTPPVPAIDFGMFGGALPVSALLEFAFPDVAGRLRRGEQWETTVARRSIDGNAPTAESVVAHWTIDRIETAGGATLAHVTFTMRRPDVRTLRAAGSFVLDAAAGVLLELSYEETVPGTWEFMGDPLPFVQTTTLHITADATAGSEATDRP